MNDDLLSELAHPTSNVLGLLARAKAEIERLTKWRHGMETVIFAASETAVMERRFAGQAEAEVERLKAENARLREALRLACTPPWPEWFDPQNAQSADALAKFWLRRAKETKP